MGSIAGVPNFLLGLIGLVFALYITQDKWRGKIGI
jgi:hypothetical protein